VEPILITRSQLGHLCINKMFVKQKIKEIDKAKEAK
jgi:hypothetical protein